METIQSLLDYFMRIAPGFVLIILVFVSIKPNSTFRVVIYILSFILMRDALTPLNLWSLGTEKGFFWMRINNDPLFLIIFGVLSLLVVIALYAFDKENRKHLIWFQNGKIKGLFWGIAGCILVVSPFFALYRDIDVNNRGGMVENSLLIPLLIFAILGNLLEESLFRGYALGLLKKSQKPVIAGINSGILFATCHVFLAITVTSTGAPPLIFALWEGIIAGLVASKYGVIPATLTHGGAVFLLCSGLI